MPNSNKIVVFGAGATGRGHVGLLAWQCGFDMVFVDTNLELIKKLRAAGKYQVQLCRENPRLLTVDNCKFMHSSQREDIAREIVNCVLVLTSVFDQNLQDVAKTIALAVKTCNESKRQKPLNFIACENMQNSSSVLGQLTRNLLKGDDLEYVEEYFGFPDCMISRVVPRPEPDPLLIIAEDYNEWTAKASAFKGEKLQALKALELVDNQAARLERKFFIHNGGHAMCGYMGFHRGHNYIHQAVKDNVVVENVVGILHELGEIILKKHDCFTVDQIREYQNDLARRGKIEEMKDQILRVVRQPIRKLSPSERFLAPALLAAEYGLSRRWIVKGIVAAMKYYNPDDEQSVELRSIITNKGPQGVLEDVCRLDNRSVLYDEILNEWDKWPD